MLPVVNRLRTSAEFSTTVRSGARSGRRNVVLYAAEIPAEQPTRIGFIVSKSVGNAVTRNLVKRRLRALAARSLVSHPAQLAIVVRALPAAANASWEELSKDYVQAWSKALRRLDWDTSAPQREKGQGA